ncbi:hypothetical protein NBRC116601_33680 [Cognatishimia sp. WU-CL00825]|uniref:glycosyltransferase n=1 Tax=Cognatishimia sp. WU-CL00825 TaxID=3127658 RepID=UPI003101B4F3
MLNRIRNLYLRYEDKHLELRVSGFQLVDADGTLIGNVDSVILKGRAVEFHGWSRSERISLISRVGQTSTVPSLFRKDVRAAFGGSPHVGFCLTEAYGNGSFTLSLRHSEADIALHVRPIARWRRLWSLTVMKLRFVTALSAALPAIAKWALFKDFAARHRVKTILGLQPIHTASPLDPQQVPHGGQPVATVAEPITIILPVYNAFDLLPEVLERVVAHTDVPWRLVVIEDCSTDQAVRPWLRQWAADHAAVQGDDSAVVDVLENAENLGFIKSVNRGLDHARPNGQHVVLLNSDALVPAGWAGRLIAPIVQDAGVATTTPMSNDAEIFSVPVICERRDLQPGQADAIDKVARNLPPAKTAIQVPTGVGFCMAINRRFLKKIPHLDTAFGRGYGEEVDWCQKVRALGGRHVAVPNLFVEHRGGASFGSFEKRKLIQKNNEIVASRYPDYDLDVQRFIKADPLGTARMVLAIAWVHELAAGRAVPIYLAHSMGGGADIYLEQKIQNSWSEDGLASVILRVGGDRRWQIEIICGESRCSGTLDYIEDVQRVLAPIGRRAIVYSCGVGDHSPLTLPQDLLSLRVSEACRFEILVHDYFMISPSYTLLDDNGVFHGLRGKPQGGDVAGTSLQTWQAQWGQLVDHADQVTVFSQSSQDLFLATYPESAAKMLLKPHQLIVDVPHIGPPAQADLADLADQVRVVAVLGNIGFHKGAAVLCELAELLKSEKNISLMVLGDVDPSYVLPKSVYVHGAYALEDLEALVARFQITDWLIPSIWPETFSYTTHEALATGMPTYAFDIGGQGDAVGQADNGHLIPYFGDMGLAQSMQQAILAQRVANEEDRLGLEMKVNE